MKTIRYLLVLVLLGFSISCQKGSGLTTAQIVQGLKDALNVGTGNSVTAANQTDGYFENANIKIPFPSDAQFVADVLAAIPVIGQPLLDELILKLNRAAENAAILAKPIFLNAILSITFDDALGILDGPNDAATQYLKSKTYNQLKAAFAPDINNSLSSVGATQAWSSVTSTYNSFTISPQPIDTDLGDYTTGKALDGLFYLLAKEEAKIRTDPAARIDDILKTVFGGG